MNALKTDDTDVDNSVDVDVRDGEKLFNFGRLVENSDGIFPKSTKLATSLLKSNCAEQKL